MIDNYIYVIVALLPLAALILIFEVNPYHALVVRAILGAVAALVYAVLGAADVALTEALVGTMLAITLYVVAVRSSLVMRLGILKETEQENYLTQLIANFKKTINQHHLRLELIEYPNLQALEQALISKEVHAICTRREQLELDKDSGKSDRLELGNKLSSSQTLLPAEVMLESAGSPLYQTAIRVRRLFEIMQTEAHLPQTTLTYVTVSNSEDH